VVDEGRLDLAEFDTKFPAEAWFIMILGCQLSKVTVWSEPAAFEIEGVIHAVGDPRTVGIARKGPIPVLGLAV
jgi:hypothetical protein